MLEAVNSILIVGGGSAGWLTALVLSAYCPFLQIRLVRPRDNNPIGVGESTQPDLPMRLQAANIDLADFCMACDATMKCGIFYRHWNVVGDHYWHPFTPVSSSRAPSASSPSSTRCRSSRRRRTSSARRVRSRRRRRHRWASAR